MLSLANVVSKKSNRFVNIVVRHFKCKHRYEDICLLSLGNSHNLNSSGKNLVLHVGCTTEKSHIKGEGLGHYGVKILPFIKFIKKYYKVVK